MNLVRLADAMEISAGNSLPPEPKDPFMRLFSALQNMHGSRGKKA